MFLCCYCFFIVVAHIGGRKPKDLGLIEQSDHHVAPLLGCSTTMLPHYHASVHLPCNLLHRVREAEVCELG